ncbi:MAG: 4-(cytidine 5'-diphospho)-2-C-methyl-D-erythritol kinase [Oscillospiraceae bacterium]|nr:4-(cytidine 5'-diphospho)-2-C-methyl-D-erythritol kinase [Oscillospiraceae bacterium]
MEKISVIAPAKLNLSLDVTGLDERGYHTLDMVMQTVSVYERLTITKREEGISLSSNARYIPTGEKNVAYKAAKVFFETTGAKGGCDIYIKKSVPIKAGMAGGSADAAGVLVGLNELYKTGLSTERLRDIGSHVGSDVPFMVIGGTKRVQGVGDIILPAPSLPHCRFVICMPSKGVSTPAAFSNYDALGHKTHVETDRLIDAIRHEDVPTMASLMANDLEEAAGSPDTPVIRNALMDLGALGSIMTGSGAAVFGVFPDTESAAKAYEEMKTRYRSVFLAHPVRHGAVIRTPKPSRNPSGKLKRKINQ